MSSLALPLTLCIFSSSFHFLFRQEIRSRYVQTMSPLSRDTRMAMPPISMNLVDGLCFRFTPIHHDSFLVGWYTTLNVELSMDTNSKFSISLLYLLQRFFSEFVIISIGYLLWWKHSFLNFLPLQVSFVWSLRKLSYWYGLYNLNCSVILISIFVYNQNTPKDLLT